MIRFRNRFSTFVIVIISLLWPAVSTASTACNHPTLRRHTVIDIIDTRTLRLDDGTQLRLAGILGPTPYDSPSTPAPWPPETAAQAALAAHALGHNVSVSLERNGRDRYGRYVGQIFLGQKSSDQNSRADTRWLQAMLVRAGHARVLLTPEMDPICAKILLTAEAKAAAAQRGLWQLALYNPKRAEDIWQLLRLRSTYQIIEGVIARVSVGRSAIYLNFGRNWKRDFTVRLSRFMVKRAGISPAAARQLKNKSVRVRGWIEKRNGPLIRVWRAEQVELLDLGPLGQATRHDPPRFLGERSANRKTVRE